MFFLQCMGRKAEMMNKKQICRAIGANAATKDIITPAIKTPSPAPKHIDAEWAPSPVPPHESWPMTARPNILPLLHTLTQTPLADRVIKENARVKT